MKERKTDRNGEGRGIKNRRWKREDGREKERRWRKECRRRKGGKKGWMRERIERCV